MEIRRGDIVIAAIAGDYGGKPRPALVVQSDLFNPTHSSVLLCPITTEPVDAPLFRIEILPSPNNGLITPSQIMADKIYATRRDRIGQRIGISTTAELAAVERALVTMLGLTALA